MAFTEKDRAFLNSLPGKTKIVEASKSSPSSAHKVIVTNSKGIKSEIRANSLQEFAKGLEEKAKDFDLKKSTQEFIDDLRKRHSDNVKWLGEWRDKTIADIKDAMAKVPEDLKLRSEIIRAYLNADPQLMYKKIDELKKFEGDPEENWIQEL